MSSKFLGVNLAHEGRSCGVRLTLDHDGVLVVEVVNPDGEIGREAVLFYNTITRKTLTERADVLKAFKNQGSTAIAAPEGVWDPSDTEKLDWLGKCNSFKDDSSGWTFQFLYMDLDESVGPTDVTLAVRGPRTLTEAVGIAMRLEKEIGKA